MRDISNVIKTAEKLAKFRRRDKFGRFLPGLRKTKLKEKPYPDKTNKTELTEEGCVELVTAMMSNISKNIDNPKRVLPTTYSKNVINYLNNLIKWIKKDKLWIPNWCEIYDFDEEKVKDALIDKIESKLIKYDE